MQRCPSNREESRNLRSKVMCRREYIDNLLFLVANWLTTEPLAIQKAHPSFRSQRRHPPTASPTPSFPPSPLTTNGPSEPKLYRLSPHGCRSQI